MINQYYHGTPPISPSWHIPVWKRSYFASYLGARWSGHRACESTSSTSATLSQLHLWLRCCCSMALLGVGSQKIIETQEFQKSVYQKSVYQKSVNQKSVYQKIMETQEKHQLVKSVYQKLTINFGVIVITYQKKCWDGGMWGVLAAFQFGLSEALCWNFG